MYIYAKPNEEVESVLEGANPGLVGTVGVQVINTATEVVVGARTTAGIKELPANSGAYYTKIKTPGTSGTYSISWDTGVVGPLTAAADILVVTETGRAPEREPEGTNLITLEELKIANGETGTVNDQNYTRAIESVSEAIRKYTDRSFGLPLVNEVRIYDYDVSGYIDIDDCTNVDSVEFKLGELVTPVQSYAWRAEPAQGPVHDYLVIPHWAGAYSPEMGFRYNLDVISRERGWPGVPPVVLVKATFGWPQTPADVREAAILVATSFSDDPEENVSESIENYAYSKGGSRAFGAAESVAISGRAKDLLSPYVRPLI